MEPCGDRLAQFVAQEVRLAVQSPYVSDVSAASDLSDLAITHNVPA